MDKVVLQVNDIFSQAWKGCQKPMWFKVLNIDRTSNSIEVECHSFDGLNVFPEVWSLDTTEAGECWQEMEKHKYFGWIKGKDASIPSRFMIINSVRDEEVSITSGIDFTYSELVEYYTFIDGTPFGVKGEE